MKAPRLQTNDARISLVEPNIDRDAKLGVQWLNGKAGRATLLSMGNTKETIDSILPTTLEQEADRVRDFIERKDQLNWMIECEGHVVGSTWVDLNSTKDLPGPSVHIMIGDQDMRGKGIGKTTVSAVLDYLEKQGHTVIYSRYLTTNDGSERLLRSLGFTDLGAPYVSDTLEFQNVVRKS